METLLQDISYGLRMLRKSLGFTAVAVLTLALGIGACTAIFSVADTILLRPLPYKEPERLIRLWETSIKQSEVDFAVSAPNFNDWRSQQSSFEELAALELATFNLTGGGEPERVAAASVTANLTSTLGIDPVVGRTFLPEEEKSGHNHVVLLSYGLWQHR